MRPSGEPEWHEHRARVPLTGREPLLRKLRERLSTRAPGWGWISLCGPSGAGVTRMLDEVHGLLVGTGRLRPLRLRPAREDRRPMAALRRALCPLLTAEPGVPLHRVIARVHPGSPDEIRTLAAWLAEREPEAGPGPGPDAHLVRGLLERLVPAGPVLVDDLQHVDEETLAVLMPSAQGRGPGVLAGVTGTAPTTVGGTVWTLDALGTSQVELLLKRWLKQPATARRLAAALTEPCRGWPGRIVEAVRALGRSGHLERRDRGVVVARAPDRWPDGRRRSDTFREWVKLQGVPARRVLDLAALQGEPHDIDVLADAAGVKRRFVEAMLAEAAAARGGLEPGRFFVSRARRRAWLEAVAQSRREDAEQRLAAAGQPPVDSTEGAHFDACAAAAREALDAGDADAARARWCDAVRDAPPPCTARRAAWHEGLADVAAARGRVRAADAHRARAARLYLAAGILPRAAIMLDAMGEGAIRRGRFRHALAPLERAATIHALHGDLRREASTRYRRGRVLAWLNDYPRAVEDFDAALHAAEGSSSTALLPRVHRALAAAWRGCGDLARERHHAELAARLATTALARVQAAAVLARADMRAGVPGAEQLLSRCEADLRTAGFEDEADRARAALVDARLRAGDADSAEAILPAGPAHAVERLAAARVDLAAGRSAEACATFELLGADASLPADLRAACYARLADALRREGSLSEARAAAVAASGLLQVGHRSRANDARLHEVLARVFRSVGELGRAVGHRSAARRDMRNLVRAARDPHERHRLMRAFWRRDPRPGREAG